MTSVLSFNGTIQRFQYALWSVAIFFSQHLVMVLFFHAQPFTTNWSFYVLPLRSLVMLTRASDLMLISALAFGLLVAWVISALAFRRAALSRRTYPP
jgi:hypothetical protein